MAVRKWLSGKWWIWACWLIAVNGLAGYFVWTLYSEDRSLFLIGQTTHGHHQIELACDACHTSPFGGIEALQKSCMTCHGAELAQANDTHPRSKFTDPRNADRTALLDARLCVTCHREHRPGITLAMGLTLPEDYCFKCHQTIAEDRPSHKGASFAGCAGAGCHNFHDNRALYEDFLMAHLNEPPILAKAEVALRNWSPTSAAWAEFTKPPLDAGSVPAMPGGKAADPAIVHEWAATTHARAGASCNDCHMVRSTPIARPAWTDTPGHKACAGCHESQVAGFLGGRHGMRLADGLGMTLSPMTPAMSRLPMKADAHDTALTCATCHGAHGFETKRAAVEACTGCHDDEHTRNYANSPHARLWQAELAGAIPPGGGVSCATCHLPRETVRGPNGDRVAVQHNQNLNLRPNEKMIRSVCMSCHGLGFSLDALADPQSIRGNFSQPPSGHVESLDWAERRARRSRPSPSPVP